MFRASWKALLTIGMLLPAAGIADEQLRSDTDGESLPDATLSVDALNTELLHASRWKHFYRLEAPADSDQWSRPVAEFDFQDTSALARISKLDTLSLLTLAEVGQARLFLGVNNDGFVGLHFDVFPHDAGDRYLEVVRMPYLKEKEPDNDVEQVVAESN
jgi:hypothetical protein